LLSFVRLELEQDWRQRLKIIGMQSGMRLTGVELCASDLGRSRVFYEQVVGLKPSEEEAGHHVMFDTGEAFLCVEVLGAENYLSQDKAVIFLEVDDLAGPVARIGQDRFIKYERKPDRGWAVLHDPDGHNVLFLQRPKK
jgi:predicted enzyme related to lactoylglutathione lyase